MEHDYTASIMADDGEGLVDIDIRTLSTTRLSALRVEAAMAGDTALVAAADSILAPELPAIFGVDRDELLAGLERIRERLCCYRGPMCDCKYGASGKGEQTGCPEIREAMLLVAEEFDKLTLASQLFEENSRQTMNRIAQHVDRWRSTEREQTHD